MTTHTTPHYICQKVDYQNHAQCIALIAQLQHYAKDPMGGGAEIPEHISSKLISEMAKREHVFSILLLDQNLEGECCDKAVGFANCIESFSTFKGKPVINIHDFAIDKALRGKGLAQILLSAIDDIARAKDACKVTLEVLEGNKAAQHAYIKAGFVAYELDPAMGRALFWEKPLN